MPKPIDLVYDLREAAEAIEVLADFCRPYGVTGLETCHQLSAAQLGPVLGILARTLMGHIEALDRALSA